MSTRVIRPQALAAATLLGSMATRDFIAIHMTWGAINELTTLTGYHQLMRRSSHPVLHDMLRRVIADERRHFAFYRAQAKARLEARPSAGRLVRFIPRRRSTRSPSTSSAKPRRAARRCGRSTRRSASCPAWRGSRCSRTCSTPRSRALSAIPATRAWPRSTGTARRRRSAPSQPERTLASLPRHRGILATMTETIEAPRVAGPGSGLGGRWRVIVRNDNHNTFEHVAHTLAAFIPGVSLDSGFQLADRIHNSGQAIVWSGDKEAAELYWEQLNDAGLTMAPLEQG